MLNIRIKELMEKNDLTISKISKISGISRTTINNLVNGSEPPKALQLETMYQLSSIFSVSIDELFQYEVPYIFHFDLKRTKITSTNIDNDISIETHLKVLYENYKENIVVFDDLIVLDATIITKSDKFFDFWLKFGLPNIPTMSDIMDIVEIEDKKKLDYERLLKLSSYIQNIQYKDNKLSHVLTVCREDDLKKSFIELFNTTKYNGIFLTMDNCALTTKNSNRRVMTK